VSLSSTSAWGPSRTLLAVPRPGLRGFTYLAAAMAVESVTLAGGGATRPGGPLHPGGGALREAVYAAAVCRSWPGGLTAALAVAAIGALETGLAALALSWPLDRLARSFGWTRRAGHVLAQAAAAAGAGAPPSPRRQSRRR